MKCCQKEHCGIVERQRVESYKGVCYWQRRSKTKQEATFGKCI